MLWQTTSYWESSFQISFHSYTQNEWFIFGNHKWIRGGTSACKCLGTFVYNVDKSNLHDRRSWQLPKINKNTHSSKVNKLHSESVFFWSPLVRRHLFWPPYMVYISVISTHILHITNLLCEQFNKLVALRKYIPHNKENNIGK